MPDGSPITEYALRITHYGSRITEYVLRITHYGQRLSPPYAENAACATQAPAWRTSMTRSPALSMRTLQLPS